MKKLALEEAKTFLDACNKDTPTDPIVVLRSGEPVAVLVPVGDADLENVSLSYNPDFMALLEKSRRSYEAKGGTSLEEVCREFGLPLPGKKKRKKSKAGKTATKKSNKRRTPGEENGSKV